MFPKRKRVHQYSDIIGRPSPTGVARGGGGEGPSPPANEKNIKASLVNLTLNMRYKNDKKITNLSSPHSFFQAQNAPKSVFVSDPDPAGGAYDAPRDP